MDTKERVTFKRILRDRGDSTGINLPKELLSFLGIEKGDELTLLGDVGKHGKYLAIYKENKKE